MSGIEVAKKIRNGESSQNKQTPIIALTAHVDSKKKEECLRAGIDTVLSKPLSTATAFEILKVFVPKRRISK